MGLKEADAFQRLVYTPPFLDSVYGFPASKKQTPFSVWYVPELQPLASAVKNASKKQTPFSVWY